MVPSDFKVGDVVVRRADANRKGPHTHGEVKLVTETHVHVAWDNKRYEILDPEDLFIDFLAVCR